MIETKMKEAFIKKIKTRKIETLGTRPNDLFNLLTVSFQDRFTEKSSSLQNYTSHDVKLRKWYLCHIVSHSH